MAPLEGNQSNGTESHLPPAVSPGEIFTDDDYPKLRAEKWSKIYSRSKENMSSEGEAGERGEEKREKDIVFVGEFFEDGVLVCWFGDIPTDRENILTARSTGKSP